MATNEEMLVSAFQVPFAFYRALEKSDIKTMK